MTVAVYKWIEQIINAADSYLKDPTPQGSELVRTTFNEIASLVGPSEYSLRQIYGALSNRREQDLVAIALWSIGDTRHAQAIMDPRNPTNPQNLNIDQCKVYTRLRQAGVAPEPCLVVCQSFPKPLDEKRAGIITLSITRDLPDYSSNPLATQILEMNICPQTPLEILVKLISPKSELSWRDLLGMIFEKQDFNTDKFIEAVSPKVPKKVSKLLANEILSQKGNFEATKFLAGANEITFGPGFLTLVSMPRSKKASILKKLLINGFHDEKYIVEYFKKAASKIEPSVIKSISLAPIESLKLQKMLYAAFKKFNLSDSVIARVNAFGIENIQDFEIRPYYEALKKAKKIDLILALIKVKVIDDPAYIIKLLSRYRIKPWSESFRIFQQQMAFTSEEARPQLAEIFLEGLEGDELLEVYTKFPNLSPKSLHQVAAQKIQMGEVDEARDLLSKNMERGHSPSVALYLDEFSDGMIEDHLLEKAAESNPKYSKMLAIRLIKAGDKERATQLLRAIAGHDDEAAHILIYVLGVDVKFWADMLSLRNQSFRADRFANYFASNGLKKLPESELETKKLHDLKMAQKLGISQRKAKSKNFEIETWACNLALIHPVSEDWGSSSCSSHRLDVSRFESMGILEPLSSEFWKSQKETLTANSSPFLFDKGKYVSQSVKKQSLRNWQEEALQSWAAHGRQGIVEAATGSGKSRLGVLAALEAIDDGFAVLIVVPNRLLQQQWIKDYFLRFWGSRELPIRTMGNEDTGSGAYTNPRRTLEPGTITVAVVNTVSSIDHDFRQTSDTRVLLIVDEVHNFSGDKNRKVLNKKFERRLGLTATLEVPTGRYPVLSNYFSGHPVYQYGFSRAVEEDVISSYDLLMIRVPLLDAELTGYRLAYQEMISCKNTLMSYPVSQETSLAFEQRLRYFKSTSQHSALIAKYEKAFEDSDRFLRESDSKARAIQSVASFVKSRGYALVFCDLNTTCLNVEIILSNQGVKAQVLNQSVPPQDRVKYFSQFESRDIQALIAPKVLDEGVDIRLASVGIFAGTSRRKLQTVQRLGRVLRKHPNKSKPLIILPVGIQTEEDPEVKGNESLSESTYFEVFSRADVKKCYNNTQESEIREFLRQRL